MRVFNLTDIETPTLKQRGLVGQHFAVGTRMVAPGEYIELPDTPSTRADLHYLLTVGAVCLDTPPPPYAVARQAKEANAGHLAPIAVRHVEMRETALANEPAPNPMPVEGASAELVPWDATAEPGDSMREADARKKKSTRK